jgi:hypothetical protein
MFFRGISVTNFFVASSALAFQAFVLYPWHKQLDEDFEALKKENQRVLQALQNLSPQTLNPQTLKSRRVESDDRRHTTSES